MNPTVKKTLPVLGSSKDMKEGASPVAESGLTGAIVAAKRNKFLHDVLASSGKNIQVALLTNF